MTAASGRWRRNAAVALVVVTAMLLAAAAVSSYARSALADTEEFTARATAALGTPICARCWPAAW
jgi:hypothetical protein